MSKKRKFGKQVTTEYCHNCGKHIKFELDLDLNGNHIIPCPECGHEHCRVIENGRVTGERWDHRNGLAIYFIQASSTTISSYVGTDCFLSDAWLNASSSTYFG